MFQHPSFKKLPGAGEDPRVNMKPSCLEIQKRKIITDHSNETSKQSNRYEVHIKREREKT